MASYLTVSTGQVITSSINTFTVSSGTTYARTLSTTNLYADYIKGDGSQLSNVAFSPLAYSIPWNAMQPYGGLVIQSGDWYLQNVTTSSLAVSSFMSASSITTRGLTTIDAEIAALTSRVICSFFISTDTLTVKTNFFGTQYGDSQYVTSSFMKYLSADTLAVGNTSIDVITGKYGQFSSISTGVWNVGTILFSTLALYDAPFSTQQNFTMSASRLLVNGGDFLGSSIATSNLASTTRDVLFQLYTTSNIIDIRQPYSTLVSSVIRNFFFTQSSVSSLSTTIGLSSNFALTSMSNLSVAVSDNFVSMCNYTINAVSSLSTVVSLTANSNLSTLSNYTSTSLCTLTVGLSTAVINLSNYTTYNFFTLSTNVGSNISTNISTVKAGISSVGFLMASGISTSWFLLSTASAYNFSNTESAISTSISNLSATTQSNFLTFSTVTGSNLSSLNEGILSTFSTLSTSIGIATLGLSSFSTVTGSNISSVNFNILSTFSTLSTSIGSLTEAGSSNISTLNGQLLSTISTFSTGISFNSVGLSTFSTITGSNLSTLNTNLLSTISSFSTIINTNFLTLQSGLSTFSTITNSNFSTLSSATQFYASTLSTSIGILSNTSLSAFSTLSTAIGATSNYLPFFSTLSTIIQSSFSTSYYVIETGLSTLSTAVASVAAGLNSNFSSLTVFASSISSGNINTKMLYASTLSTNSVLFMSLGGSTISSLTQNVGRMNASQMVASSFSGNYADALTLVVQIM